MKKSKNISRRNFIAKSGLAMLGSGFLGSSFFNLNAIAAHTVRNRKFNDYKAMVCLMMEGGADSFNILIPRSNVEYNIYSNSRSNLAIPQNELLTINPLNNDGILYGLHPQMSQLQTLFNTGELSFISNVGSLIEPVTKDDFWSGTVDLPLGLFSHADQSQQWQNGRPGDRTPIGWGGRISDIMSSENSNQVIPMSVSLSGNNVFQHGIQTIEFVINESGIAGIEGYNLNDGIYNQVKTSALDSLFARQYNDIYKSTYISTLKNANSAGTQFMDAIENIGEFATQFSDTELSQKFKMIAKTIAARDYLGFDRQIFFVRFPAWDHHDDVLENMNIMLPELCDALSEFNSVMHELDTNDMVTTFSMSDFGRTLSSNGNGSDHAWGGNTMVMGGAVNGQRRFGEFPDLQLDSDIDVGGGVIIPQISSAEYLAEIAMWFGISNEQVYDIFPNLLNFYDVNSGDLPIGFLNF